jgi:hypothetical protein
MTPNDSIESLREPPATLYVALAAVTTATLLLELGLTRLFSVLLYYHMAFFAVSVTLFGLAFGGAIVHFLPRRFTPERATVWMTRFTLLFSLTTALALIAMLSINFDVTRNRVLAPQLLAAAVVLGAPFTCSGVVVAIGLTRFPARTNRLYGVDLAGAALGCLLYAPLMNAFGAPRFIIAVALATAIVGAGVALAERRERAARWSLLGGVGLSIASFAALMADPSRGPLAIRFARSFALAPETIHWEAWNAISRVTIGPVENIPATGVDPEFWEETQAAQEMILIDLFAATPIFRFGGRDFSRAGFAFRDVSYLVHALRPDSRVAAIGVGGGRDVLAAKAWGQPEVVGIEINGRMIEALTEVYADYAGRPAEWPGVEIVHDEARSYLSSPGAPFDIIQASLIDTFAATSAGAFVLTENSLYTIEGWAAFVNRLTPDGMLTMSRWHNLKHPVETIRLLALARATLEARGVARPIDHLLMARARPAPSGPSESQPLATIVVKKSPFTEAEIDRFETWTRENRHVALVSPRGIFDPALEGALTAPDLNQYARAHPFDVSPPTDDRPFFFDVLRWRDILKKEYRQGDAYIFSINFKPIVMLGTLLATVILMASIFVVIPAYIESRRFADRSPLTRAQRTGRLVYFMMLGLGYLTIELTLMQRLTVFLGHPTYSLTVVLFTMLLSSGLGSMVAPRLFGGGAAEIARLNLILFICLLATLAAGRWAMGAFVAQPTATRIVIAGLLVAPAAFLMGMPFPLAIQAAARDRGAPLSWYWAINGALSVCASVVTVVLAHAIGLSGAFLCGAACYLIAAAAARAFAPPRSDPSRSVL